MADEMSKSAKKRAAKKARDEAGAPAPEAAAAAPKAEAKAKAKAKAKAAGEPFCSQCGTQFTAGANFCNNCGAARATAASPAESKVAPKAEAKKAAEKPKAEAKSAPKAAAKATPKPAPKEEEDEPVKKGPEVLSYSFVDDGSGGDWEKASGLSKKAQKQRDAKNQRDAEAKAMGFANAQTALKQLAKAQNIPGFNPLTDAKGAPAVAQGMVAGAGLVAKIQAEAAARVAVAGGAVETTETTSSKNLTTTQIPCPPEKIGRIVGPKGATLQMLKDKCGVDRVDTADGMVTLVGEPDAVRKAEVAVKEMIDKGFMSIQYDNFGEQTVMVHPVNFPDIIGSKGAIIQKLKQELKVEITIPQGITKDSKGSWGKKKHPVTVAGSAEAVEKAKEVINDIVYYKHHPITHEGLVHEEMEIEEWTHRFIIGPKGSEMRHIQNNFKVKVNIPRDNYWDTGANPNVLIVGERGDVEKAKKHIEKVIYNAENNVGGRGREDAAMGDERDGNDDIDAVAAQYLYKRK